MGANFDDAEPWKLVDYIKSFNWLNYEGGKFSTSQGRGVFMDQALDILPSDYWRWWLLSNAPEGSDSDFTWEAFQTGVNKDLADVLGNFVSRVTKFCRSKFGEAGARGQLNGRGWRTEVIAEEINRPPARPTTRQLGSRSRSASAASRPPRDLGHRQRVSPVRRTLGRLQDRPRSGRRADRPLRPQPRSGSTRSSGRPFIPDACATRCCQGLRPA